MYICICASTCTCINGYMYIYICASVCTCIYTMEYKQKPSSLSLSPSLSFDFFLSLSIFLFRSHSPSPPLIFSFSCSLSDPVRNRPSGSETSLISQSSYTTPNDSPHLSFKTCIGAISHPPAPPLPAAPSPSTFLLCKLGIFCSGFRMVCCLLLSYFRPHLQCTVPGLPTLLSRVDLCLC